MIRMDLKKDFTLVFRDKNWLRKTLIGGLFIMFPILDLFSFGFTAKFIHDYLEEGKKELPGWEDFGKLFFKGFEWGVIIILYFTLPLILLSLLPGSFINFMVNPQYILSNLEVGGYILFSFSALIVFVILFFLPMALILFSDTGSFIAAFNFEEIYSHIKKNFGTYLMAYILTAVLVIVIFVIHLLLNNVHFGLIPSYFLFMWFGFIVLLISASLFIESF